MILIACLQIGCEQSARSERVLWSFLFQRFVPGWRCAWIPSSRRSIRSPVGGLGYSSSQVHGSCLR